MYESIAEFVESMGCSFNDLIALARSSRDHASFICSLPKPVDPSDVSIKKFYLLATKDHSVTPDGFLNLKPENGDFVPMTFKVSNGLPKTAFAMLLCSTVFSGETGRREYEVYLTKSGKLLMIRRDEVTKLYVFETFNDIKTYFDSVICCKAEVCLMDALEEIGLDLCDAI